MARALKPPNASSVADHVLGTPESSVLELIDSLLNKGVMATGDVTWTDAREGQEKGKARSG